MSPVPRTTYDHLTVSLPPSVADKLRAIALEHFAGNVSAAVVAAVTKYVPASS